MKFISTFTGSFYSAETYRALRHQRGLGLAYSFMLILAMLCATCIIAAPTITRAHEIIFVGKNGQPAMLDDLLNQIASQTPEMIYKNQVLTTKVPGPHVIRLKVMVMGEAHEGDAITIDTSGQTTYANMNTPVLITANEIVSKQEKKTEIKTFKEMDEDGRNRAEAIHINAEKAKEVAKEISQWAKENLSMFYLIVGSVTLIVVTLCLYIARITMLLLLALAGMLIANILNIKMSFEGLMRFSAVSFTPVSVCVTLMPAVTGGGEPGSLTLFVLGVVMLSVALYTAREEVPAA